MKALVIYPMNALATDQAARFAQTIATDARIQRLAGWAFIVGGKAGKDGRGEVVA